MTNPTVHWWVKMPFVRLLPGLVSGIIIQWEFSLEFSVLCCGFLVSTIGLLIFSVLSLEHKFRFSFLGGLMIFFLMFFQGCLLIHVNDVRQNPSWIGNVKQDSGYILARLEESLSEKTNSYKALSTIRGCCKKTGSMPVTGKFIIYFKKDTGLRKLQYGSLIVFKKPLQSIKSTGNPGSFDYSRYCLFQGIGHQVYLLPDEFITLDAEEINSFRSMVFEIKSWVIGTLRKFIPGEKEKGLAEALLIGYKDDLDKSLVQAYSNTGVVHVIAISGLHLGLIYVILLRLTKPIARLKWVRFLVILSCLWLFSILAGAQPSVLRSALMFTCIALGEVISRKGSVFNTLALSAFILLCYQPFWLWDVGFQLSYAAVCSILVFFKPVYNWFYLENKILDNTWKLCAVTIAAQLFTLPFSIYHFHQLPTLFLFTNLVAVPLSSLILIGELLLVTLSFLEPAAKVVGYLLGRMIRIMNHYIESFDSIYFGIWSGLSIDLWQAGLLIIFIACLCSWLLTGRRRLFWYAGFYFFFFSLLRCLSFYASQKQCRLIVYNIPRQTAIDLLNGRQAAFFGDSVLLYDDFLNRFHLHPSRMLHRVATTSALPMEFRVSDRQIAILNRNASFLSSSSPVKLDVLILCRNISVHIEEIASRFDIRQVVIDASVPYWKAQQWKAECKSLAIACHDIAEKGAFVLNLN